LTVSDEEFDRSQLSQQIHKTTMKEIRRGAQCVLLPSVSDPVYVLK